MVNLREKTTTCDSSKAASVTENCRNKLKPTEVAKPLMEG